MSHVCSIDCQIWSHIFSDLASFVTLLFDTKIVDVCKIIIGQPQLRDGAHFVISKILGIVSYLGHTMHVFDGRDGVNAS